MSTPKRLHLLVCLLAVASLAVVGCQKPSSTEPASESPDTAASSDQGPVDEVTPGEGLPTMPVEPPTQQADTSGTLGIGSPAPPLSIAKWVVGEPLESLEPGKVHVIEFWATWCPPCRASMPHLSDLQQEYADEIHVVGVTDEPDVVVEQFLDRDQSEGVTWKEVVKYRLAIDDDDQTTRDYRHAAGQDGIPVAFIVGRDGVIDWIGHPLMMDKSLRQIVDGTWDRAAAVKEFELNQKIEELTARLSNLVRREAWDDALAMLDAFESEEGESRQTADLRNAVNQMKTQAEEAAAEAEDAESEGTQP